MEVLVKITEKNGKSVVRARDLHQFLESKQEFANWIKNRIEKYGLVENEDYVVFDNLIKNPQGGRPQIEYALTIDAAKRFINLFWNDSSKEPKVGDEVIVINVNYKVKMIGCWKMYNGLRFGDKWAYIKDFIPCH